MFPFKQPSRWLYLVLVSFSAIFVNGLIYGWAPLLVVLRDSGVFSGSCDSGAERNCDEANVKLTLCFTCGAIASQLSAIVFGPLMDYFGPRAIRLVGSVLFVASCLMLGFSTLDSPMWFVGFTLMSLGGGGVQMTNFHISALFPRHEATVVSLISGFFSVSSYVFLGFKTLYFEYGWTLSTMFKFWSLTGAVTFVSAIVFPDKQFGSSAENADSLSLLGETTPEEIQSKEREDRRTALVPRLHGLTLRGQLFSFEYVGLLIFYCWWLISSGYLIASITDQLLIIGDDTGYYSELFAIISPLGFLVMPLAGSFQDRFSGPFCIAVVIAVNLLWQVLIMLPLLRVQVAVFVLFTCANNAVYSVFFAMLGKMFGFSHFGLLVGLSAGVAGLLTFAVTPLYELGEIVFERNYLPINAAFAVGSVVLFALPAWMHVRLKRWREQPISLQT